MSNKSRKELVKVHHSRYLQAIRGQKGLILDEFVAVTGLHRKSAIRRLGHGYARRRPGRGRPRVYNGDTIGGRAPPRPNLCPRSRKAIIDLP